LGGGGFRATGAGRGVGRGAGRGGGARAAGRGGGGGARRWSGCRWPADAWTRANALWKEPPRVDLNSWRGMSLVIARPFAGASPGGGGARPICSADAPAGGAPKVRGAGVGAAAGRDGAASMDA